MAAISSNRLVSSIQSEIQRVTDDLRGVDENLKRLTGRDFNEPRTERRIRVSSGGREDEPPLKRRAPGGVFARLGEPVVDVNRGRKVREISEEEGETQKPKPSLPSSVARPVGDGKSRTEAAAELTKDRASRDRNRRMFGALLGTLQRFRNDEAKQKDKDEQRAKIDKKLEEKGKAEKEELRRERLELLNQRKERQARIRRLTLKMARVKEHEAWEDHQRKLKNFIRTEALPHIFWLPSLHNPRSSQLVSATKEIIERELEDEQLRLKDELDEVLGGRFDLPTREEDYEEMEDRVERDHERHSLGEGQGPRMDFNNGSDLLDYEAEEGELVYEDEDDELMLTGKKQKDPERVVVQVDSSVNCAPQRRVELVTVVSSKIRKEREEREKFKLSESRKEREKFKLTERDSKKEREEKEKFKLSEREGSESEKENRVRDESREDKERVAKKGTSSENFDKTVKVKEKTKEKDKKSKEKERVKEKEKSIKNKDNSYPELSRTEKSKSKEFINGHSSEKGERSTASKGNDSLKSNKRKSKDDKEKNKSDKTGKSSSMQDEEDKNEAEEIWSEDLSHISLPLEPEPAVTEVVVQHVRVNEDANEDGLNADSSEMRMETVLIDTNNIKQDKSEWEKFEPFKLIAIKQEKNASPPPGSTEDLKKESKKDTRRESQSKQSSQDRSENEASSGKNVKTQDKVIGMESHSGGKKSSSKEAGEESTDNEGSNGNKDTSTTREPSEERNTDMDSQSGKSKMPSKENDAESDSHSSSSASSSDSEDSSSDSESSASDSSDSSDSSSSDSEEENKKKSKKPVTKKRESSSTDSSSDDEKERRPSVKSRSAGEKKASPRSSRRSAKEESASVNVAKKGNERRQVERDRNRERDDSRRGERERVRDRGREREQSGSGRSRSKDVKRDRSKSRSRDRRRR